MDFAAKVYQFLKAKGYHQNTAVHIAGVLRLRGINSPSDLHEFYHDLTIDDNWHEYRFGRSCYKALTDAVNSSEVMYG